MLYTEEASVDWEPHVLCDGTTYPLVGQALTYTEAKEIFEFFSFAGFTRYGSCMEKTLTTYMVGKVQEKGYRIVAGDMRVFDGDTAYGFDFNPPFELHTWLQHHVTQAVIDLSLPGVIERAHKRGYLTHIMPVALAGGKPETFGVWYNVREEFSVEVLAGIAIG